jgi:hypothetical protein
MTAHRSKPITIDEYMEMMTRWISVSPKRTVRRGHPLFEFEDMQQEARFALLEVFHNPRYQDKFIWGNECEVQKIGRRAIFQHAGNLAVHEGAKGRKDACVLPIDVGAVDHPMGKDGRNLADEIFLKRGRWHDVALDRVIIRDEVDRLAGLDPEAHAVLDQVLNDRDVRPAPLPTEDAERLFKRVGKQVKNLLLRDGYIDTSGVHVNHQPSQGGVMNGVGPESPDVAVADAAPQVAAEKPKRSHHKKKDAPAAPKKPAAKKKSEEKTSARQSAAETKSASSAFKKGQVVVYAGGGRAGWLSAQTELEVKGTVMSRGRMYVKCYAIKAKRPVSLSSTLLIPKK